MNKKIAATLLLIVSLCAFVLVPAADNFKNEAKPADITQDGESSDVSDSTSDIEIETTAAESKADDASSNAGEQKISPDKTPVSGHGQLSVKGANIVDKNGDVFQLKGMSTHGLQWFPQYVNKNSFRSFRDDWGVNCIRLAMYTEENGYISSKEKLEKEVRNGIDICVDLGLYVIVDWHILSDGNPNTHKTEAIEFFKEIASDYNDEPNIIYEICNEPNGNITWDGDIKPYCEDLIKEIRTLDGDAVVIAGTPTWSQDIDKAEASRLSDENTVYALHFYAATHTQWLRDRVSACAKKGLPIFVSEFGTCDASGTGGNNLTETESWLKLLDENKIGYVNWNISDKNETSACFKPNASADGDWTENDFSDGAKFFLNWIKKN